MLKKILSLFLTLTIVCGICSCDFLGGNDVSKIITDANEQLDTSSYTVNIDVNFTSDDEDMKEALAALKSSKITLAKSGENLEIKAETSFDLDVYSKKTYTVAGDRLYSTHEDTLNGALEEVKSVSLLTAANKAAVVADTGAGEILTYDDFNTVKLESSDTVHLITCTELKTDSAQSLVDMLKASVGDADATVAISDAELVIRIVDGKYNGTYLSCIYSVTLQGVTYDVRMQAVREYDHTTPVSIVAPDNADQYVFVSYDEILK